MTIPYITPTQQQIPKQIYKFRFINRLQMQKLLKHKDKRRINSWLKDLVEKEYLEKVPKNNSFEERTKLTIYRIGVNGIRFLKTHPEFSLEIIRKLYRDGKRTESFIDQCILLTDIYLSLILRNVGQNGVVYEVTTNSDLVSTESPLHFLKDLNPDLIYAEIQKYKKLTNKFNLIEVFEKTIPNYSIKKRIRTYLEFYFSNEWEDNMSEPFPTVKFICSTKTQLMYAKRCTKKLLEENQNPEDFNIMFITIDEVKDSGITLDIWEKSE